MADAQSSYTYSPIDLATDAIRLIRLLRGSDEDPVKCDLFETFLHQVNGTPYEALSYTWGDSTFLVDIEICGKPSKVRDNLYAALRCLRRPDQDRLLWIDAICIDQQSHFEKGHQVGQMTLIYENAQNVHIWLGRSDGDIDFLMDTMRELDHDATSRPEYRRNSPLAWSNQWPIHALRAELRLSGSGYDFSKTLHAGWEKLLSRPWFQRVWIIQEIFNARMATIGCGSRRVPTRTFVLMPTLLQLNVDPHIQALLDIMPGFLRQQSWHSNRPTLYTLLQKFSTSQATDSRDKIYALLGIASDRAALNGLLQPDYDPSVTPRVVTQRTISYLLFGAEMTSCELPEWDLPQLETYISNLTGAVLEWSLHRQAEMTAIEVLKRTGFDPNKASVSGDPPLVYLSTTGTCRDVVRYLLNDPRTDVNIEGNFGYAPINRAAEKGDAALVELLLRHRGVNIYHTNNAGETALEAAARGGHTGIVRSWLAHDSRVSRGHLERAASLGPTAVVEGLPGGNMIDIRKRAFERALDEASKNGRTEALKLLITRDETLVAYLMRSLPRTKHLTDVFSPEGPLSILCTDVKHGHLETTRATLEHFADPETMDNRTPKKKLQDMVTLLLDAGVPVDTKDAEGRTLFHIARKQGNGYVIKQLVVHGADINQTNTWGESILWTSSRQGQITLVRDLLSSGAAVDQRDSRHGCTPLFIATYMGYREIAEILIKAGADITAEYRGVDGNGLPGDGREYRHAAQVADKVIARIAKIAREIELAGS